MNEREIDKSCAVERVSSANLDYILGWAYPVLDHGFVRVIDYMGNDTSVVQAARVSYGRGNKHLSEDVALIRYMMRHHHTSVFEQCEIKFHIKLPIFVARQFIRHRTANVNEYSARYSILDKEFYLPSPDQLAVQSASNRQGRSEVISADEAEIVLNLLREDADTCYAHYTDLLNDPSSPGHDPDRPGLARELARMNLTLNTYTQWYWKCDLHNLFHFLGLRLDTHAQYEIRVYAEQMFKIVESWVPISTQAFYDYKHKSVSLSRMEVNLIQDLLKNNDGSLWSRLRQANNGTEHEKNLQNFYGLSLRELREFRKTFL